MEKPGQCPQDRVEPAGPTAAAARIPCRSVGAEIRHGDRVNGQRQARPWPGIVGSELRPSGKTEVTPGPVESSFGETAVRAERAVAGRGRVPPPEGRRRYNPRFQSNPADCDPRALPHLVTSGGRSCRDWGFQRSARRLAVSDLECSRGPRTTGRPRCCRRRPANGFESHNVAGSLREQTRRGASGLE